ncbi:MAG: hypothetical protein HC844_08380 [Tabrizicola sp.]|nr:hypothetical protein [Tabrizicola sp.]
MQQLLKTLALPALCLTALPALAETTGIVAVPAFDQLVAITLPEGFVPAYAAQNDEAMLWEAIPRGETVENWTEMITISGVKPQQELSASDFARYLARSYLNACPPTYSDTDFGPTAVPGGADAFAKWVSCGQVVARR